MRDRFAAMFSSILVPFWHPKPMRERDFQDDLRTPKKGTKKGVVRSDAGRAGDEPGPQQ